MVISPIKDIEKCNLKFLKLEKCKDIFYIHAGYEIETKTDNIEYNIHAPLPVFTKNLPYITMIKDNVFDTPKINIDLGFGELENANITRVCHKKCREMTIEEIEKALGHPVKIIGDKFKEE